MIRSATPQLSKKVLSLTDGNNNFENAFISLRPSLMIAAYTYIENQIKDTKRNFFFPSFGNLLIIKSFNLTFVLFPISRPSTKPVPFVCHSLIVHKNRKKGEDKVHIL